MARSVILDTDLGSDIDDIFAIGMMLNSPELKTELILTATWDAAWRASEVCKFLEQTGHAEVDVGIGLSPESQKDIPMRPLEWVGDYSWKQYSGQVYEDGISRAIDVLDACENPVLIAIAPLTNVAEICRRRPDLIKKCELVAMSGSIHKGYNACPKRQAEYNVFRDIPASKTVYSAPWKKVTITPLDTCGTVILRGEQYRQLLKAEKPIIRNIMENFRLWVKDSNFKEEDCTSTLYDTVAIHLAISQQFLKMENVRVVIDDKGVQQDDPAAPEISAAVEWTDYEGYSRYLTERLCR